MGSCIKIIQEPAVLHTNSYGNTIQTFKSKADWRRALSIEGINGAHYNYVRRPEKRVKEKVQRYWT